MDPLTHLSVPPEYAYSSSLSDVDSLSDSDWLDISSHESDNDNDSVCSRDIDHDELDSVPHSRRSSLSVTVSLEGEVVAWEGLAEDTLPSLTNEADIPSIDIIESRAAEHVHASHPFPIARDNTEEQLVKAALDQSLISTLSSSRPSCLTSSSTTPQTSLRDLRLSFPDPLTSSLNHLDQHQVDVTPSKHPLASDDDGFFTDHDSPTISADQVEEAEQVSPPAVQTSAESTISAPELALCDFDLVLYGSLPADKWLQVELLVDNMIHKVAMLSDCTVSSVVQSTDTRLLQMKTRSGNRVRSSFTVYIVDASSRDARRILEPLAGDSPTARPSLAIVFLPSTLSTLPEHSLYLPVFSSLYKTQVRDLQWQLRDSAQKSWNRLGIPASKTLQLTDAGLGDIIDCEALEDLEPSQIHMMFQHLATPTERKPSKTLPDQFSSVHTMSIVALLSLLLGFAINLAVRSPMSPTRSPTPPSTSSDVWRVSTPVINVSEAAPPSTITPNVAVIPSSLKDFALAVFNPAPLPSVSSVHSGLPQVSQFSTTSLKSVDCGCGSSACFDQVESLKEVKMQPMPSTSSFPGSLGSPLSATPLISEASQPTDRLASSLSVKFVDSLSEVFQVKALAELVRQNNDLDLVEALDELVDSIAHQVDAVTEQSKERARDLHNALKTRNERAKEKAKQLREIGTQALSIAGEQLKERAQLASKRARQLRENLIASDLWDHGNRESVDIKQTRRERKIQKRGERAQVFF